MRGKLESSAKAAIATYSYIPRRAAILRKLISKSPAEATDAGYPSRGTPTRLVCTRLHPQWLKPVTTLFERLRKELQVLPEIDNSLPGTSCVLMYFYVMDFKMHTALNVPKNDRAGTSTSKSRTRGARGDRSSRSAWHLRPLWRALASAASRFSLPSWVYQFNGRGRIARALPYPKGANHSGIAARMTSRQRHYGVGLRAERGPG
jgi:hypothetical protein